MTWGFIVCGPNEAMVVSGCFFSNPVMISGGRKFVWPIIHKLQKISLNTMTLIITSPRIYTQLGVPVTVTGVAQIKINGSDKTMLATACEQFLGKTEDEIRDIAKETLEAHQRAIMGNMTVEEIYKDRKKFSSSVFEVASGDMINMGISVVSYTLKDIQDDEGYLKALGEARTAQVKRDARIGEAEAKKDSGIKEAYAEQHKRAAQCSNDVEIAQSSRDFELKKAEFEKEVQSKRAESDFAYDLQAAKTQQKIREEEMMIKVIERKQRIEVERLEILRQDRNLEATVRKPADSEKYRMEKIGHAEMNKIIRETEAEAERIRLVGLAESKAIQAKAKAESEQMRLKAEAWNEYEEAARLNLFLDMLPQLAAEIAAPLSRCGDISLVCTGNGEIGASKLTGEILSIMEKLPLTIEHMTGSTKFKQIMQV